MKKPLLNNFPPLRWQQAQCILNGLHSSPCPVVAAINLQQLQSSRGCPVALAFRAWWLLPGSRRQALGNILAFFIKPGQFELPKRVLPQDVPA
ncbi:MAG: hypothetical protein KGZ57_08850 [Dethiobacter sp.]|nr:hypothetical protein [Dethiobacter sp.]